MRFRSAFTIIELIFVIIILALLSVVALPRFLGVSDQAQSSLCDSAIGTMNRTVGLNFWSKSLADGKGGAITVTNAEMRKNLPDYNASLCGNLIGLVPGADPIGDGEYGSPKLINDGNMTHAPRWIWVKK